MLKKLLICLIAIIFLNACKTFSLVNNGALVDPGGIKVKPIMNWNQQKTDNEFYWTLDGRFLNEIGFISVKENEYIMPLKNRWGVIDSKSPKYNANMNILEIPAVIQEAWEIHGFQKFTTVTIEPTLFLKNKGFKFHFTGTTLDGLNKLGIVYGTIIEKKLYIMMYSGAVIEFYEKGKDDFIQMAESATL